jgi:hypothetical protein
VRIAEHRAKHVLRIDRQETVSNEENRPSQIDSTPSVGSFLQEVIQCGNKGKGIYPTLDKLNIPSSTAYWWIDIPHA